MTKIRRKYTVQLNVILKADNDRGLKEALAHLKQYPPHVEVTACDLKVGCYSIKSDKKLRLILKDNPHMPKKYAAPAARRGRVHTP